MKNHMDDNTHIIICVELTERPVVMNRRAIISARHTDEPAVKKVKLEPAVKLEQQ